MSLDDRRDRSGANTFTTALTMDARPASYVHVSVGPALTQQYSTDQYVRSIGDPAASATFGSRYVFANLRQSTLSLDARVDWTFTPTLTLQVYAQPFLSAGRYSTFKALKRSRSYDFSVYGKDVGTIVYDSSQGVYNVGLQGIGASTSFAIANPGGRGWPARQGSPSIGFSAQRCNAGTGTLPVGVKGRVYDCAELDFDAFASGYHLHVPVLCGGLITLNALGL